VQPDQAKPDTAQSGDTRRRLQRRAAARALWNAPIGGTRHRLHAWLNMLFVDHGALRAIYLNRHPVGGSAYRAAQPLPGQIAHAARALGVRTVISLRGGVIFGSLPLEKEACARAGIAFDTFVLRSRALPTRDELHALIALAQRVETPVLFHCKSGADRAGFMAALWLVLVEGRSVAEARGQLSLRYGHLKAGPTGILDVFFDRAAEAEARGVPFLTWIDTEYDRDALTASYEAADHGGVATWLVDRLLRRE
jgi:protein tyrosine/serine phosphatase